MNAGTDRLPSDVQMMLDRYGHNPAAVRAIVHAFSFVHSKEG